MGKNRNNSSRIAAAAIRSLWVFVGLAVLLAVTLWFVNRSPGEPDIPEAKVTVPAPQAHSQQAPKVLFTDITAKAGIDFVHVNGAYGKRLMPEAMGSGAAFFDYDNDGDQDIFLVNSRDWPGHEQQPAPVSALYENNGHGQFKDVSAKTGLNLNLYGMGVAVGDYDNDGWNDLFISTLNTNLLLHNEQGLFHDVSNEANVAGRQDIWSSSAAFFDFDNDGDLDLFVGNYVRWSPKIDLEIDFRLTGIGRAYGQPSHFLGTYSSLYLNQGNGHFKDISKQAGIEVSDDSSGGPAGKALGVMPVDYDQDGWIDLIVANDTVSNFLFHNLAGKRFEEVAAIEGIAYDRSGKATGAMGIDAAWLHNNEDLGVAIGNFGNEMSSLFMTAQGRTPFADEALLTGIGPASRLALTFGLFFFDYDLDGRLDFFQANGHLEPEINQVLPSQQFAQPAQLFWNCGHHCRQGFILVEQSGDLQQPLVGRGATYADIDADGDLDILVTQNGRAAKLFRNDQALNTHWLRIQLEGNPANRNAIGAIIELTANGVTQRRQVMPTRSYFSQVELPVTFGLGKTNRIESLRITWPGGQRQSVKIPDIDQLITIKQQ